eukprot:CAMPEP_0197560218 /NCGR_PEP_ID=MMETSP1320-20131121/22705_1 /TAXON_ID=91990 /ORGANISM="Bolidomonas sp., Strain RCC2347" /LENGTH=174 /DNA_ID=CAMNT_0043121743 /DNA_START=111 /DNA_END=632 /DNA_ORIENTATION=+
MISPHRPSHVPPHTTRLFVSDGDESNSSRLSEEDEAALRAARKVAFEEKVEEMGATRERAPDSPREAFTYTVRDMTKAPSGPAPTTNVKLPLLGTIEVDGSSLLVVPAAVIGVLGVLTSLFIGLTSTDSVERALEQLREDEKAARSTKKVERKDCRGLCGSQEDDLSRKLGKME